MHEFAGISLSSAKQVMVASRLAKRLQHYALATYKEYYQLVTSSPDTQELQIMVNILTTNETFFFREPKHFEFLQEQILKNWRGDQFKIWSAASSTGEEVYTLAMLLAESLGNHAWEILGSDLNTHVLDVAKEGVYPMKRLEYMPLKYLQKYCLRGVGAQEGMFRVVDKLKSKINFCQINLMHPLASEMLNKYEVIFLRNVLIYFDNETQKAVVQRLIEALKPGGYFFISHSENLFRITDQLHLVTPSIYKKK